MSNLLEMFVKLCLQFAIKFVPGLAVSGSQPPLSTSTSKKTPPMDFDTSARNAIRPSAVNRNPRLSEAQALAAADQVIKNWTKASEQQDHAVLKQMIAQNFLALTDRAAHLGSVTTMNEVMWASHQVYEEDAAELLHLRALEQGHIASDLLRTLQEVDQFFVLVAMSINELLEKTDEEPIKEHLTAIRQSVMLADEAVRERTEDYEA